MSTWTLIVPTLELPGACQEQCTKVTSLGLSLAFPEQPDLPTVHDVWIQVAEEGEVGSLDTGHPEGLSQPHL